MPGLPAMLNVAGKRCLIVGGGSVALRRARALLDAQAKVTVVAPNVDSQIRELGVTVVERPYCEADLAESVLVVVATDDSQVNNKIAADARTRGVWVNRTDDPTAGDLTIPAHARHGLVTIAVDTGGTSAAAAAAIRRELSTALNPDWPAVLAVAAEFRKRIQTAITDPAQRTDRLRRLTGDDARAAYRDGGADALRQYSKTLADPTANLNPTADVPNDANDE